VRRTRGLDTISEKSSSRTPEATSRFAKERTAESLRATVFAETPMSFNSSVHAPPERRRKSPNWSKSFS